VHILAPFVSLLTDPDFRSPKPSRFDEYAAVSVVAREAITVMGLLWYIAAILTWWITGTLIVGASTFGFAIVIMLDLPWWLPYTTWIALGELIFFSRTPNRKEPFVFFAILSLTVYAWVTLAVVPPKSWPLLGHVGWPAAIVTVLYLVRHFLREAPLRTEQVSSVQQPSDLT